MKVKSKMDVVPSSWQQKYLLIGASMPLKGRELKLEMLVLNGPGHLPFLVPAPC